MYFSARFISHFPAIIFAASEKGLESGCRRGIVTSFAVVRVQIFTALTNSRKAEV